VSTGNDENTKSDPELALLEEGAVSYVPAVGAILAFRALVQSRCRQVVQKRLKEYGAALGVGVVLKADGIRDYQGPGEAKWGADWASVGVELRDVGPADACLYHVMGWYRDDDGNWINNVGVSVWLKDAAAVQQLSEAFKRHAAHMDFWQQHRQLGCSRDLEDGEAATFEVYLDELLVEWIKIWTRVGGFKLLDRDG